MEIKKEVPLAPFTTFKVGGLAEFFTVATSLEDLKEALEFSENNNLPIFILGGGSNVVISDGGVDGMVVKLSSKGTDVVSEDDGAVLLKVAAGEQWDEVVAFAVARGWWGMENLSHIPGTAGAVAVQNVGAYGQEASQIVESVEVVSLKEAHHLKVFTNADCQFSYRGSIFNSTEKNKYAIVSVTFRLSKKSSPNLGYGDVKNYFSEIGIVDSTLNQIREAIIIIRDRKFPYPKQAINGNAGSFFKAHTISEQDYGGLVARVGQVFGKDAAEKLGSIKDRMLVSQGVKVPYGYLIELCGLRGKLFGNIGVCQTHAGVLLNVTGLATAHDVLETFKEVRQSVYAKTGIILQNEPELVGFTEQELAYYFSL